MRRFHAARHLTAMPRPLELWFELASTYSYVGAMRAEAMCAAAGVPLVWRPFLLGPIFTRLLGIKDSPFNVQTVRGRYMWRDLERLCEKHGLPWRRPSVFPRSSLLATRVACVGLDEPWGVGFVRDVYAANFAEDRDIADPAVLSELLAARGVDAPDAVRRATTPENKARLAAATAEAERLGIFGAPSMVVATELFFGQDRLEDAIAWA